MDREGSEQATPVVTRIVECLSDYPVVVFSRYGDVLMQTRPALVLLGDWTTGDPAAGRRFLAEERFHRRDRLRCFRHAEWGELELCRRLLVEPEAGQVLLVFTAVPGSSSEEKLRLLAAGG